MSCLRKSRRPSIGRQAGVLEISLPESGTLDMEDLEETLGDDRRRCLFASEWHSYRICSYNFVQRIMKKGKRDYVFNNKKLGGYFCADTADLSQLWQQNKRNCKNTVL